MDWLVLLESYNFLFIYLKNLLNINYVLSILLFTGDKVINGTDKSQLPLPFYVSLNYLFCKFSCNMAPAIMELSFRGEDTQ